LTAPADVLAATGWLRAAGAAVAVPAARPSASNTQGRSSSILVFLIYSYFRVSVVVYRGAWGWGYGSSLLCI
jgi:hypothetical protein